MLSIELHSDLKEDYLDTIRYWQFCICRYSRLLNMIESTTFCPFRGLVYQKLMKLKKEAETNKVFYTRLYCVDDLLGSVSRKLGIKITDI